MASQRRIEKLNILLREELATIIDREFEFPGIVTLTRVDISPDAHYATVFFSVLDDNTDPVLHLLEKHLFHIQQMLNRHVRMRPVPKIRFALDRGEMQREKIEKSITQIKREGAL